MTERWGSTSILDKSQVLETIRRRSAEIIGRRRERDLNIAVTRAGYDDIGSVVQKLDYTCTVMSDHDISDLNTLKRYNIVLINCGTGGDPGTNKESLREFVRNGGVLYGSDLSAPQISMSFPNHIGFSSGSQADQLINANIVDRDLERIIGSSGKIYFDLPDWIPIEKVTEKVHIFLTGSFGTYNGSKRNKPILVSSRYGTGEVVYTSFHNHKQTTKTEEQLLKFLVLK